MSERRILSLILLVTALLGWTYAVINPVFEGGDELWHYPMVQHLANGNSLPVQVFDPAEAGPWKQQASQPPLYYYAAAALTFWIDTDDMHAVRWQNPHVDNGIVTTDGNRNLTIHNPDWNPWQGTLLAVRVVRFFSVLLGVGTVYFTWQFGRIATRPQNSPYLALTAAALVAFLPMRLFVSAAVNNDNGIIFLSTVALYLLASYAADTDYTNSLRHVGLIGLVIGFACLTKIIGVGLLPLAFGAFFLAHWRMLDSTANRFIKLPQVAIRTARDMLIVLAMTGGIAGWWYVRNVQLYDDWRGWSAFIAVLGKRNQPASLAQLWSERDGFMQAYWGLFGGVNVPMHATIYLVLNGLLLLAVTGFAIYLLKQLRTFRWRREASSVVANGVAAILDFASQHAGVVIALVWTAAIVSGLINWATTTWSSQGRLVFGALQAQMVLVTLGLFGWAGAKFGRIAAPILATALFSVAAISPFLYIQPAYKPSEPFPVITGRQSVNVNETFNDTLRLDQAWIADSAEIRPNGTIDLLTVWTATAATDRNWSVFVHLNDTVLDTPIAQRDMYLGQGTLATSFLKQGDRVYNRYRLNIPPTVATPADLTLNIGLYDFNTCPTGCERMTTKTGADNVQIDTLRLESAPDQLPNATDINFADQIALVGYEISDRQLGTNEPFSLTMHLSPRTSLDVDYSVTTQIVSEDLTDTTRWAAVDSVLPSSNWQVGEIYPVTVQATIDPDTPSNVYRLIMGLYTQTDGSFRNLNLVQDGRITNDNLLTLTKVRIEK